VTVSAVRRASVRSLIGAGVLTASLGCAADVTSSAPPQHKGSTASVVVTRASATTVQGPMSSRPHPRPLAGKTVGIDPGHNGRDYTDTSYIDHQVWNGREYENCNETGTETDAGYTEASFNFHVATYLRRDLRAEGADVVMTRHTNHGVGPCVNTRAEIINHAHANVGIDIHGDGGPASGRGFAILKPVADKENRHVIGSSAKFAKILRHDVLAHTSMPTSTYDGVHGLTHRDNLAGLNLTKVPLVLIECGNMRNATDAHLMTSRHYQRALARAFALAITTFVRR
jgi:N-acetylmuramoyl-L-alanine amidase